MFDFDIPSLEWRDVYIPKKSGGKRHIAIPNDNLKAVQHDILHYLNKIPELRASSFAHGFVTHRSTCTGALMHNRKSDVLLSYDVKDFFDNFPVEPVRERLLKAGIGEGLTNKILTVCTRDGHFPQGSPCSPFLTNVGMYVTDLCIAKMAKDLGLVYTRYADDLTFTKSASSPYTTRKNYKALTIGLERLLSSRLGLHLKVAKTRNTWLNGSGQRRITGVVIRKDGFGYNAPKELRHKARGLCHNMFVRIKAADGKTTPKDHADWMLLKGLVSYSNHIREQSVHGTTVQEVLNVTPNLTIEDLAKIIPNDPIVKASTKDPAVHADEYAYLESIFRKEK